MKKVLIIGAGPAGLTAAYELLHRAKGEYEVIVFEESSDMGGISRTVNYKGNRMDMGGHRFFSKVSRVNEWWETMLPMQGAPSMDDIAVERRIPLAKGGPDPEKTDRVMLHRNRVSRIYFDNKFYDYPIQLKPELFINMGLVNTLQAMFSYLGSVIHKREEKSLEDFYINRFGKKLYSMFFENYTESLWGRHPSEIDPSWGAQRAKGLSVMAIIKDVFGKMLPKKKADRHVETSLIEAFQYPKLGPGQLWDVTASEVEKLGGTILKNAKVTGILKNEQQVITSLCYRQDGEDKRMEGDIVISSMPLKDLIEGMNDVPAEPLRIAKGLPYRDYRTLGVLVPRLNLKNKTKIKTVGNIVPDNWVYVHDRSVKMGLIDSKELVLDAHAERVKKAYPAYFDTYEEIDKLIAYINTIDNLYCVGRNGQHRYNNIDHSMMTSFETVDNILSGKKDKSNIWNVNTEKEYHEKKEQ